MRMRKDEAEIRALLAAGAAIDHVHSMVPSFLQAGRTEREVGADIAEAILDVGHVAVDFVIVASGPNGASPHHEVSDRVIENGDVVVVDIGGTMPDGYRSDCTRTYAVGWAPADFMARYVVLQEAQQAAVRWARAGVTCESVDAAARDVLEAAGLGELFIHRTGHGIGLETHEDPYIVVGNDQVHRTGHGLQHRAGLLRRGQLRSPNRGHRHRHRRRSPRGQQPVARSGRGVMAHVWKGASVSRLMPTPGVRRAHGHGRGGRGRRARAPGLRGRGGQ